ncbi:TIGR00341 family protein [Candidatus Kaiserbacteria bacterium CG10_big_fil_rev_8_21_14_0_10_45_20]|uniref:TIGR00341 family protein n=1 Tax=Candidatus Kaiserbacteria bacterium CG10_big_fil_rev_8_21_14_0_10_45_20 TaxID=1974607 RepID=A0A2H0UG17_9BACT|nr:MAG: TIGR00341 family protein [Candidatus Kaiserbacteria bacterium CG10_big_fil_rev_8_21_14_0_10_45_20]
MNFIDYVRSVPEKDKSGAVKKLIEHSTPSFDFFFLVILSVLMATFGILENSPAVVIGSMLIAPILFPVLSLSLSIVMADYKLITRASKTLLKAVVLSLIASVGAALFFGVGGELTSEALLRTEPTLISVAIAIIAGFAVAYTLARPGLNETLPGIAVAVALIPPIATIGIGIAKLNIPVIVGATVFLVVNIIGIVFASMLVFSLMNLYVKRTIASKVANLSDKEVEEKKEKIQEEKEKEEQKESQA